MNLQGDGPRLERLPKRKSCLDKTTAVAMIAGATKSFARHDQY